VANLRWSVSVSIGRTKGETARGHRETGMAASQAEIVDDGVGYNIEVGYQPCRLDGLCTGYRDARDVSVVAVPG
jgi:hypothetical protein